MLLSLQTCVATESFNDAIELFKLAERYVSMMNDQDVILWPYTYSVSDALIRLSEVIS